MLNQQEKSVLYISMHLMQLDKYGQSCVWKVPQKKKKKIAPLFLPYSQESKKNQ